MHQRSWRHGIGQNRLRRRKHLLPSPLTPCVGILAILAPPALAPSRLASAPPASASAFCLGNVVKPRQLDAQHLLVQKQNRTLGLILRRRRHIARARQVAQKPFHMTSGQGSRVLLAKINDVTFNPINLGLPGAQRVMLDPDAVTHLIQQTARAWGRSRGNRSRRRDGFHGIFGRPK